MLELLLAGCFRYGIDKMELALFSGIPIYLVNCYGLTVDQIVLDGGLQEWIME